MNRLAVQTERNAPDTRTTKNHSYTPERPASAGPLPIDRGAPTLHKTPHETHLSGGWGRRGCSMARNAPDTRTTKKTIHTRQRGPLQPVLSRLIGERLPCTKTPHETHLSGGWGRQGCSMARNAPDTRTTKNHSYTPERPASAGPLPIDRGAPTLHKTPHKAHLSGGWGRQGCSMARNAPDTRTTKKTIHTRQRGPFQPVLSRLIGERRPAQNAARNAPIRRMRSAGLLDGTERTRYPNNQKKHSYTPERPASAGPLPIDRGAPTLHKTPHKAHLSGGWGRQGCSMARWHGTGVRRPGGAA